MRHEGVGVRADSWKLSRRLQLFVGKKGKRVSVFAPVVGPKALAIAVDLEFRLLLDRRDLAVLWKGRLDTARPVGWNGEDLHLLDENWRFAVWDSVQHRQKWATEGADCGYALWKDKLLLIPAPGRLEMRDPRNGRVVRELPISGSVEGFYVVGDHAVLVLSNDHVQGLSLASGEVMWSLSLREAFGDVAPEHGVPLRIAPGSHDASLILNWRPVLGALDVTAGRLRWRRELRTDGPFRVSRGRVGLLSVGHLFLCDEATGETIVDVSRATPTVWECPPIAHEDWMVVVDEQGYIVTVALSDGAVVGVQKEKGTGFMGCVSVDGRLLVGGLDGALWVYEPAQQTPGSAEGRSKKASSAKQLTPDGPPGLARGSKGRSAGRPASKTKVKRR